MRSVAVLLLTLLSGCTHLVWYGRSADRRHVAAVIERGSEQFVRHDTRDGKAYAGIGLEGLRMDGTLVAYPAQRSEGWVMVVNGVEGERFDAIGEVIFEGGRALYAAQRAGKWFVVDGKQVRGPFDELFASSLRRWGDEGVFAAQRDNKAWVIAGEREMGPFDAVGQLHAEGDWLDFVARTAAAGVAIYSVRTGEPLGPPTTGAWDDVADVQRRNAAVVWVQHDASGWRVSSRGELGAPFDRIAGLTTNLSGVAVYAGRRAGAEFVVFGAQTFGPFKTLKQQLLTTERGLVFAARENDSWFVHRADARSGPWEDVSALQSAGEHDAFVAEREGRSVVVLDGAEHSAWEVASGLVLHANGRVLFIARAGAQTLLVDGEKTTPFDLILEDTATFSRSGNHFAVITGERKTKKLFITFDDGSRVPVDLEELTAELMRAPPSPLAMSAQSAVLRRWVGAELAIRFGEQ
ncbi:MAG: hypothetical protein QM817_28085 [Archangium sp.]